MDTKGLRRKSPQGRYFSKPEGEDPPLRQHLPQEDPSKTDTSQRGGEGQGAGDREKGGREVYGRREKRGGRKAGEKGKNYATLHNILQSKKCKGAGAKKYRVGTGIKGYGKREVQTPLSPPTKGNASLKQTTLKVRHPF